MSRFYGSIKGQARTEATRRGSPSSGLTTHTRGWDLGVRVRCRVANDNLDVLEVYVTGGSNRPNREKLLATIHASRVGYIITLED